MRIYPSYLRISIYAIYIILFVLTCNNPFFWDTIHLASMQAHFYYENDFRYLLLPPEIDSGHPPLMGLLLAAVWKLFNRSLGVSHLLMLPFLLLLVNRVMALCEYLFSSTSFLLPCALVLLSTVLLGQATLVSPDIILYCFFFLTLNAIYRRKVFQIVFGSIILAMISMRGMMCVCALFLFQVFLNINAEKRMSGLFRAVVTYLPSGILAFAFLYYHYSKSGWIGYHSGSPWSNAFVRVGLIGFLRNLLVLLWRFFDFGNAFMWIFLGGGILLSVKKPFVLSKRSKELLLFFCVCMVVLVIPQVFYRSLLSHRYLFPVAAIGTILLCSIAEEKLNLRKFRKLFWLSVVGLISGNLWVYPDKIAKGWDSTLAHLPYYKHRRAALDFIKDNQIHPGEIGAAFPYESDSRYVDLAKDSFEFVPKNFTTNRFVLYSNISNDFTDDELRTLKNSWKPIKQFGSWPVRFILYKNPLAGPF